MKVGSKVEHVLTKDWLLVLKQEDDRILCRTKMLEEIWFYTFELQEIKR